MLLVYLMNTFTFDVRLVNESIINTRDCYGISVTTRIMQYIFSLHLLASLLYHF